MQNAHIDNAKAALLVLVICGHFIEPVRATSGITRALYLFLYVLHMPGLALLSGSLAPTACSRELIAKNISSLIVPFIAFELLYEGAHVVMWGRLSDYAQHFAPYWLLWFLLSLFVWRTVLPFWSRLRFPLISAVLVTCIASALMTNGYFLAVLRTCVFFPFFLMGAIYRERVMSLGVSRPSRILAVGCLIVGMYVAYRYQGFQVEWVYGAASFSALHVSLGTGIAFRTLLYIVSTVVVVAFITVMPRASTSLGSRAPLMLYAYLWHGFLIKAAEYWGVAAMFGASDATLFVLVSLLFSLASFFALTSNSVKKLTDDLLLRPLAALARPVARR